MPVIACSTSYCCSLSPFFMASRMGYHAVKTLADGKTNRVICARAGQMVDIDITEGLSMKKGLNEQQYEVLQAMTGIDN